MVEVRSADLNIELPLTQKGYRLLKRAIFSPEA